MADREWEGRVYRADVLDKCWLSTNGAREWAMAATQDSFQGPEWAMAACDSLLVTAQQVGMHHPDLTRGMRTAQCSGW